MPKIYEEQCQLFIEQEIEEFVKEGTSEKGITQKAKEIQTWVLDNFNRKINTETIRSKIYKAKSVESQQTQKPPVTSSDNSTIQKNQKIKRGGKRKGSGRPLKFKVVVDKGTTASKWTGDQESYTPEKYIELAREVMGSIDTDPASCLKAQKIIKAKTFYSKEDDGLTKKWEGNIFLNPPYSQPEIKNFIDKLLSELTPQNQAILLTNNNTDTTWFHDSALSAAAICFTKGRINFYKNDGSFSSPTNGQCFFY